MAITMWWALPHWELCPGIPLSLMSCLLLFLLHGSPILTLNMLMGLRFPMRQGQREAGLHHFLGHAQCRDQASIPWFPLNQELTFPALIWPLNPSFLCAPCGAIALAETLWEHVTATLTSYILPKYIRMYDSVFVTFFPNHTIHWYIDPIYSFSFSH